MSSSYACSLSPYCRLSQHFETATALNETNAFIDRAVEKEMSKKIEELCV
jgi:hypothetical protein